MHNCDLCDESCDCDMEDHYQSQPADCTHVCDEREYDDDDYDDDDYDDDESEFHRNGAIRDESIRGDW